MLVPNQDCATATKIARFHFMYNTLYTKTIIIEEIKKEVTGKSETRMEGLRRNAELLERVEGK